MIGTMMGAVHLLPGTTFSNVAEKGTYDTEGRAVRLCRSWSAGWLYRLLAFTT
jgi:putative transposase